jgi:hypothetical protein
MHDQLVRIIQEQGDVNSNLWTALTVAFVLLTIAFGIITYLLGERRKHWELICIHHNQLISLTGWKEETAGVRR